MSYANALINKVSAQVVAGGGPADPRSLDQLSNDELEDVVEANNARAALVGKASWAAGFTLPFAFRKFLLK